MLRNIMALGHSIVGCAILVVGSAAQAGNTPWPSASERNYESVLTLEHLTAATGSPNRVAEDAGGRWMRVHPSAAFPQWVPAGREQPTTDPAPATARNAQPKSTRGKPKPKTQLAKPISCEAATEIVTSYGFSDVTSTSCSGATYVFDANRDGAPYSIKVSATDGALSEVKKR
jgi:hypothetical protein